MSKKQTETASNMLGATVRHSTGRVGVVIGVVIAKRGKGFWFHVSDNSGTWCMYRRCK